MGACAHRGQNSCRYFLSSQYTSQCSFRNRVPPAMSDSEATYKGEEEVPFTPEQIQWIDRFIASVLH